MKNNNACGIMVDVNIFKPRKSLGDRVSNCDYKLSLGDELQKNVTYIKWLLKEMVQKRHDYMYMKM